ncbi:MAG: PTS sugar transporter subunit IIA [Acidobacteriota bacterium]|nr:MAG: PTS fructose transporter subunit IIA [Thermoanaerobaculum sp.]
MAENLQPEPEDPKLSDIFGPEHVLDQLTASTREEVIAEIVKFVAEKRMVTDPRWLETALIQRERMVPTAMPNGVAFLHARHRAADKFPRQFLALARSKEGVSFGSPDERPTHLFFLLAFRRDQAHLRWLARLSWICRRRTTVSSLLQATSAEEISRQLALAVEELPGNLKIRA